MSRPTDTFLKHLREWFTVFLPRQRGASPHTIESARRAWNMLLQHVCETRRIPAHKITFPMLNRACIAGFLEQMRAERNWTAATYNQRLACIRSFYKYAAAAEPTLAIYLADLTGIPLMKALPAKPVAHMSQKAIKALLAEPDPSSRIGLRDQFFMILMYDTAARDADARCHQWRPRLDPSDDRHRRQRIQTPPYPHHEGNRRPLPELRRRIPPEPSTCRPTVLHNSCPSQDDHVR